MKSKYNYLAKNTLLFTISSFGSKLLVFFLVPLYTNILTTEEYGTADLITTTSNLLVFIVTLCIADGVLRFAIDKEKTKEGIFGFGFQVVIIGSAIAGIILYVLSIFNPFGWSKYLYLFLFLIILFNGLNQLISNYLRALDKVLSVTIMGIMVTIFTIVFNLILLLLLKIGIVGYFVSFVAGYAISSMYGILMIYKYNGNALFKICDKKTKIQMISYSFPLIFNGIAWWINSSLDRYFIVYYCGAAINGLYAAASKIPTIISVINSIFIQAWNLSAIKEFDEEDKDGFFTNIYSIYNFVLIICCSSLILLNIPLAKILFAKDFFMAWKYSSILLITAVFSALSGFFGSVFVAIKNSKIFAISTTVAAIVNLVLNFILIPLYGAIGGAIATAISFVVVWLIRYICTTKYIDISINIIRDIIAYILLVLQCVFEHFDSHYYSAQIVIYILITILYYNEAKKLCSKLLYLIKSYYIK